MQKKQKKEKYFSILEKYAGNGRNHEKITNTEDINALKKLVDGNQQKINNNGYRAEVDFGKNKIRIMKPGNKKYGSIPFGTHVTPIVIRMDSKNGEPVLDAIYFDSEVKTFSFCRDCSEDMK